MLSYAEAIKLVIDHIAPLPAVVTPLEEAGGLVLAESVTAGWDQPPADNSAMDGFAFAAAGCGQDAELNVIGQCYAGHPFGHQVAPGTAVRIMTGAPLPPDTDTVVPLEDVSESDGQILLQKGYSPGQHVRKAGEEFRAGEELLGPGTRLLAGEIGLLASAGVARVRVHPKPRVAVLATGDELVELGEQPGPGQIVNSNLHLLRARLQEAGAEVIALGIAEDDEADLDRRLREGLQYDLLLTSGGVSVGDKDQVQDALGRHGFEKVFWKAAIKPGKPILFGKIGRLPVFGLPGNPASTAATCELFAIPALRRLAGHRAPQPQWIKARLASGVKAAGKRQTFLWGRLEATANGFRFDPSQRQGSGQNRSLQGADALLSVPAGIHTLAAEDQGEVLMIRLPGDTGVYP